jgi:hypothetical protein
MANERTTESGADPTIALGRTPDPTRYQSNRLCNVVEPLRNQHVCRKFLPRGFRYGEN